jgi:acyl-coenzyme A thioesterase PaaI-like protein
MIFATTVEELQARLEASPFNAWLGLRITNIGPELVHFTVQARPEFIGTKRLGRMHGGS